MKHRRYRENIGRTSDAGKADRMGVIGGIGRIGPDARTCARERVFFTRARNLFPVCAQEDTSDASDKPCAERVSDIGRTSDVFGVPPMFAGLLGFQP